ncbi:hypothetical protein Ahy_Scaffold1g107233 isoform A [Arachis hypogaea]|uniref:G domain-containing protein n=1 Tax=Arachis hypogaea TaxID=3818 RepID=A0A444WUZ1_ARAHY|nr:hypothetical protein Ahy_Scaffold1g107233 isoform A [Arachis hypogaea]
MNANESIKDSIPLESRPGIFIIGSPNVGKRTFLSRLLSVDFEDTSESASEVNVHGWNISNKYYSADVSIWIANLGDDCSVGKLSILQELEALVMVFYMRDVSVLSSLTALQDWVSCTDIQKTLRCIGNKVDLFPGHPAHAEYRRQLLKLDDSVLDPYAEVADYRISELERTSLLGDEESSGDIRKSCLELCTENNI